MTDSEHESLAAAEYVLGLTDDKTRQQLNKRLNDDAEFAAQVQRWQKAFSGIDATTHAVTPPAAIWQRIELHLKGPQKAANAARTRTPSLLWLGWGLAAVMTGLVIFTHVMKPDTPDVLQPIAVLSGTQPDAQFVVSLDKSKSVIQVSALNVALPQNKNLQLWVIKGSAAPQSLGLINSPNSSVFPLSSGPLDNQTVLAISLEPIGGSRQAGPSGPVIFQGKVTAL